MTKLFFLCRRRAELTHEQYVALVPEQRATAR